MPAARVLALDQGTTGSTALVFDDRARIQGRGYAEFPQHYPQPGWVEHDANDIWKTTLKVARAALRDANTEAKDVAALGITNQRETLVAWDSKTLEPIGNAIVWQCRRTTEMCAQLKQQGHGRRVRARTGLLLDPYFTGTKIRWMLENRRKVRQARKAGRLRFGTVDTWLIANLTGGQAFVTDPSNASRTLLYNLNKGDWDEDLMELFGARRDELPEIVDSSGPVGHTSKKLLGAEVPIAGIAGDQQAALYGQACFKPGMAKNTYGTGCFALIQNGTTVPKPGKGILATQAWRIKGRDHYALEGSVFIAGAAVQWLRDGLQVIKSAPETERLAQSVEDTGDVWFVPAFTGLGAPHWDPNARGTILGLTRGTTRAHLARAALESIAHQSADVLDALAEGTGKRLRRLRADGGAIKNAFLHQFQADLLGVPVEVPPVNETTALGAAFLAGLGTGVWSNQREIEALWTPASTARPAMATTAARALRERWAAAVRRSRGWAQ